MVNSLHILRLVFLCFVCLDVIIHNCPKLCSPSAKVHTLLLTLQKALEEVVYNICWFTIFRSTERIFLSGFLSLEIDEDSKTS